MTDLLYLLVVVVVYGAGASFIQERFGAYQNLSPTLKQVLNTFWTAVLPYIIIMVQPYWKADWGSSEDAMTSLFMLLVPVAMWLVSQVAHAVDRKLIN